MRQIHVIGTLYHKTFFSTSSIQVYDAHLISQHTSHELTCSRAHIYTHEHTCSRVHKQSLTLYTTTRHAVFMASPSPGTYKHNFDLPWDVDQAVLAKANGEGTYKTHVACITDPS
jgi:hypothetical protein